MSEEVTTARFLRQLLLPEIGEAGQTRLGDAGFAVTSTLDGDAAGVASSYLERAGCHARTDGEPLAGPSADDVDRLAGDPALRSYAAAVAGAFAAVEHIKRVTGAGRGATLPGDLTLASSTTHPSSKE